MLKDAEGQLNLWQWRQLTPPPVPLSSCVCLLFSLFSSSFFPVMSVFCSLFFFFFLLLPCLSSLLSSFSAMSVFLYLSSFFLPCLSSLLSSFSAVKSVPRVTVGASYLLAKSHLFAPGGYSTFAFCVWCQLASPSLSARVTGVSRWTQVTDFPPTMYDTKTGHVH